jgi:hypothetical protein
VIKKAISFFRELLKLVLVLFAVVLMGGFAKGVQYASVDAFGAKLGFEMASLMVLAPILIIYYFIAKKLPAITIFGRSYG